jgi:hypothetical protein
MDGLDIVNSFFYARDRFCATKHEPQDPLSRLLIAHHDKVLELSTTLDNVVRNKRELSDVPPQILKEPLNVWWR